MYPWVESIWIRKGRVQNLPYHQARFDATRRAHFTFVPSIHLSNLISRNQGEIDIKCRIVYSDKIEQIEYIPYHRRQIRSLSIVHHDNIHYPFKCHNRDELDALFKNKGQSDEILIVRNQLFTDAYYYNLVFESESGLYTPKTPLLPGTMRQKLITSGQISPIDIYLHDLPNYHTIHLINALNPLGTLKIPLTPHP